MSPRSLAEEGRLRARTDQRELPAGGLFCLNRCITGEQCAQFARENPPGGGVQGNSRHKLFKVQDRLAAIPETVRGQSFENRIRTGLAGRCLRRERHLACGGPFGAAQQQRLETGRGHEGGAVAE